MNLFSTSSMLAAINQLPMTNNFLLKRFFPNVQQEQGEKIHFDVIKRSRRLAPFVSPVVPGKLIDTAGMKTNTFEPAYIKDKRYFDSDRPLKRVAGESIGGSFSPEHRIERLLVSELADQTNMVNRRLEVMASEVLRTGQLTITGENYPTQNINYGRDADLSVVLTGVDLWSDPSSRPLDDLEDWAQLILQKTGLAVNDVVMTVDVWKVFKRHPDVVSELERYRGNSTLTTDVNDEEGGVFKGQVSGFNIWVYSAWYVDDGGTEQPIIPAGSVILSGTKMSGIRAFGAIRDDEAGYQSFPYFPKSWVEKDPSVRYLLMQSAPLVVPGFVDATVYAEVL